MKPPQRKKVVGLVRVSTQQQAEDDRGGMPRQHAVIERTVQAQNLECLEVVELAGVSGTEVRTNPEIQRILRMIESREISGVVVADLDRLLRPAQFEDLALFDVFSSAQASVYCGEGSYDFSSPEGKFMATVRSAFSGLERQLILKRSKGAVDALCRAGKHPFGLRQLPRGISYDRKTSRWHVTEDIAPVLEAFRLIDEDGVHNVAKVARLTGINERALHNLLRNSLYMGWRLYQTGRSEKKVLSKRGKLYKPKIRLPQDQIIEVKVLECPPVDADRFARVQAVLAATTKAWKAEKRGKPINMLRSIARCAACGERLYFSQDRRRPKTGGYYFCSKHYYQNNESKRCSCGAPNMSKVEVDKATNLFVSDILTRPSSVRAILNHSVEASVANIRQVPNILPGFVDHKLRRTRVKNGFEEGLYSAEEAKQRIAQIDAEEQALLKSKQRYELAQRSQISEKIVRAVVKSAMGIRRMTDPAWRLKLMQSMLSELHLSGGQVTAFKLHPSLVCADVCEDLRQGDSGSSRRRA